MKKFLMILVAIVTFTVATGAQTNVQVQYDFGRKDLVTVTLEGNYSDNWGSTYFFADFDASKLSSGRGSYGEFSRSFNFWQNSAIKDLSIQAEVDAGLYKNFEISPAFLAGVNYTFHYMDYSRFLQIQVLYKTFFNRVDSNMPLQFTAVWNWEFYCIKGLTFMGFADFWWQTQVWENNSKSIKVFMTEPQLWYNVGQWFGVEQFNIGGEVELSYNFAKQGFKCNPSLGIKWIF